LLNGEFPLTKTLTVVDINLETIDLVYTTYDMSTMEVVDQQWLPKLIAAPNGKILRRDLQWEDLTPAEQAIEYVPTY
jgi:hypothetical protein